MCWRALPPPSGQPFDRTALARLSARARTPNARRIGMGVVNRTARIETVDEIVAKAERAIALFGADRVLLNPDCGFATFADNPIATADVAERKLAAMAEASRRLRGG